MNTNNHSAGLIQLDATFARLVSGAATIGEVLAERATARAALFASEDAYARRHREWAEAREQFNFAFAY